MTAILTGPDPVAVQQYACGAFVIEEADAAGLLEYRRLRHQVFVGEQGLFTPTDRDELDDDPRMVVLIARDPVHRSILGGVRLAPATTPDLGWWTGSRLVVRPAARRLGGIGAALVGAACARVEQAGVLRFEATVQARNEVLFRRLGWQRLGEVAVAGHPHVAMRWPIGRIQALVAASKAPLGGLLAGLFDRTLPQGFRGDDGVPVPGSDLVAACDAIIPSLVERDPEWAGWCGVLVNVNDLAAMGAEPVGLLDALAARDASFATRILAGVRRAAAAWGIPVLGGHTTLGAPAALSITALGRTANPVPAGGGRVGDTVTLTADLGGGWRQGQTGGQWDSSSGRSPEQLRFLTSFVARARPHAAKDVSMAGVAGTLGMLAEASGCGAVLDMARLPVPPGAGLADWITCFPGFGMLTCHRAGAATADPGVATSAACGELVPGCGVRLRWPDGTLTTAVPGAVTGLGTATRAKEGAA